MEGEALQISQAADYTIMALFFRASFAVQLVMIMLMASSVWVWAIAFSKMRYFNIAKRQTARFDQAFWSGEPLEDLYNFVAQAPRNSAERVFVAGMSEWRQSFQSTGGLIPGAMQRVDRAMDVAIAKENAELTRHLNALATIGSTAPFVGLFGTVWGIMRSFQEIAGSGNTSLAVVAPGIAEALLATGLGLLAAIPAVIFYNTFSKSAETLLGQYESFADEFSTLLSRQSD
jgi:biopolymer transport protein TolQ